MNQKKPVPMCVVTVGYSLHLILPSSDGMKLIDILQRSVEARPEYGAGITPVYTIKDQPIAEFSTVRANQIRAARGADGVLSLEVKA